MFPDRTLRPSILGGDFHRPAKHSAVEALPLLGHTLRYSFTQPSELLAVRLSSQANAVPHSSSLNAAEETIQPPIGFV